VAVGTVAEASEIAANSEFNAAVLDINLDGQQVYPAVKILANCGLPFIFVTGYGTWAACPRLIAAAQRCKSLSRPSSLRPLSPDCSQAHNPRKVRTDFLEKIMRTQNAG